MAKMSRPSTRRLLWLTLFSSLLGSSSAIQKCYFPDGSESGDTPCSSSNSLEVFCCPSGSQCISSPGPLCRQSNGDFVRGSCTVQDWSSSACPLFCIAINSDNPVDRCSSGAGNGAFCCGYDADKNLCNCNTNNNTFVLGSYTPIQVLVEPSSTIASSSSSTGAPPTTILSSTVALSSATRSATSSPTATGTPEGMTTGAKIGLGVAIPIGLALIGFVIFLIWRRHRKEKKPPQSAIPPSELHGQHLHQAPPSNYSIDPKDHWQHSAAYTPASDGSGTLRYYGFQQSPNVSVMHELPADRR